MTEYDITIYNGDTYNGTSFEIIVNGSPLNMVGASVLMQVRKRRDNNVILEFRIGNGLSFIDAANGKLRIDEQIISIDYMPENPFNCVYDIQITLASGAVKTYIKGDFIINGDVTHG